MRIRPLILSFIQPFLPPLKKISEILFEHVRLTIWLQFNYFLFLWWSLVISWLLLKRTHIHLGTLFMENLRGERSIPYFCSNNSKKLCYFLKWVFVFLYSFLGFGLFDGIWQHTGWVQINVRHSTLSFSGSVSNPLSTFVCLWLYLYLWAHVWIHSCILCV